MHCGAWARKLSQMRQVVVWCCIDNTEQMTHGNNTFCWNCELAKRHGKLIVSRMAFPPNMWELGCQGRLLLVAATKCVRPQDCRVAKKG